MWRCWKARKGSYRTNLVWPSSTFWSLGDAHHTSSAKVSVVLRISTRSESTVYCCFLLILWLSASTQQGKSKEMENGIKRAPHTAPPRYGPMLEDTRMEMEGL